MKITKKQVTEYVYTTAKGVDIPLKDMNDTHHVNAFGVAGVQFHDTREGTVEHREAKETLSILREEIVRRMNRHVE